MDDLFNLNPSKYPEIIIDKTRNSALNANKILSLEEYNDLMHHTHDISSLIASSSSTLQDIASGTGELYELISKLTERVELLEEYVAQDIQADPDEDNLNTGG